MSFSSRFSFLVLSHLQATVAQIYRIEHSREKVLIGAGQKAQP